MTSKTVQPEQSVRKHIVALCVAIVFAIFLICFFNLIGALITYVTLVSGVSLFGWIVGMSVTAYLAYSGLISDTLHFCLEGAKRFGNAVADGFYDTPVVA